MTVELYHRRHSPVHLQFPVKDRYDIWCTIFERAHWLTARVLTSDCVHERAFVEAIRRARVMCGLSDSLEFSGVETAVLEDAITELLDASVVDKLLLSLSGSSWKDRMSQLRLFHEKSGGLLKNFVWGKWHAIQGRTCSRRVLIEAKVRDGMDDINAFEMPLRQEVHKYTNNETQAFLAAQVEKPLKELAAAVVPQLRDVCATVPRLYEACVLQGKVHYEPRDDHMYLASQYNSIGECYEAERELWRLQEPIAAAKAHFKGRVFEWLVVQNTAVHLLRRVVVNGVFTFETVFERNKLQRPWDDALREVRSLVEADSRTMTPRILAALLYETAVHFFRDEYVQPSLTRLKASMITPLEGRVTEELRPLVPSVQEIVADVMLDDMRELCRSIADCAVAAA
ncbi:hypothetical protein DQ04_00721230 [Trypanosoma grayi]|uniref:hypothetical protein n=1 Tax=Trypanosoma grayi TaxID=71804 RepID=UPI0004F4A936|nr:hypothetical protein DQ04_00721230 [Trypanosoma grayi]KEG13921.1 hypothetical protein DQ04_00721230 [Trypanosoma grayi]